MVTAVALADFRDRVRRSAFIVVLLGALVLGYFAVPPTGADYAIFYVGAGYVGKYNSAYLGAVAALVSGLWLSLVGFYVVRNSVAHDQVTGVGEVLAGTPMRNTTYVTGKALSNLMVLGAMAGVVAVMTVVMQLIRGESAAVDLVALLLPFLLLTLPVLALTAALAVAFETVPLLRASMGNVVWFFGWMGVILLSFVAAESRFSVDVLGLAPVSTSMGIQLVESIPQAQGPASASLGLVFDQAQLGRFTWDGLPVTAELLQIRAMWLVLAAVLAVLPGLWFGRFDPDRGRAAIPRWLRAPRVDTTSSTDAAAPAWAPARPVRVDLPRPVVGGPTLGRLVAGELRILLAHAPRWWPWVAAVLVVVGVLLPLPESTNALLPLAWIWPLFVWSQLGAHQAEHRVSELLATAPTPRSRMLAEWLAGVVLTAATGFGPFVRMLVEADLVGAVVWLVAVAFVPALALALGTATRSSRPFQFVYLVLWYVVWSGASAVDFMGADRQPHSPPTPGLVMFLVATAALVGATFLIRDRREALR